MVDLLIRPAAPTDVPALAAIYNHWIATSIAVFQEELNARDIITTKLGELAAADRFLVAESAGALLGYAASGPYRPRPLYDVRELSIYVSPQAVGGGVGNALYRRLLPDLDSTGVHSLVAVIALPNPASERLHQRFGFEHRGTMRELGAKFGQRIDCSLWQRMNPLSR